VSNTTTGGDPDRDGYRVVLDGQARESLAVGGSKEFVRLSVGMHTVSLEGVAPNCVVRGDTLQQVNVEGEVKAQVTFIVDCNETGVRVVVSTLGVDLDPDGYAVAVDGGPPVAIGVVGTIAVTYLDPGSHTVALSGRAPNCSSNAPDSQTVDVIIGQVVEEDFTITCTATSGALAVTVVTGGLDLDPDGYSAQLDGGAPVAVPVNGTVVIAGLSAGNHNMALSGLSSNCALIGPNPQGFTINAGGVQRDTTKVTLTLNCSAVTGDIAVSAVTTGLDLDPDGYSAQVDGDPPVAVPANGTVVIAGLSPGDHNLALTGQSSNCAVSGPNPQGFTITAGGAQRDTTKATFTLNCNAATGALAVSTVTTGVDLDFDGYAVKVDGGMPVAVPVNGTVVIAGLSAGTHSLALTGLSSNCAVNGPNSQSFTITAGGVQRDTTKATFTLNCNAAAGDLAVSTVTTGVDLDPDGYAVKVDGGTPVTVPVRGTVFFAGLSLGTHSLTLTGLSANCVVQGTNPQQVTISGGGLQRDTTAASFSLSCNATTGALAVTVTTGGVEPDTLFAIAVDGHAPVPFGVGGVFTSVGLTPGVHVAVLTDVASNCTVGGANPRNFVVTAGGPQRDTTQVRFTVNCLASPLLAVTTFAGGNYDVSTVKASGLGVTRLTTAAATDGESAWSPDGSRIAFVSDRSGTSQIWVMNADGTGQVRLSSGATYDNHPSWSPDGSRIAYTGQPIGPGNKTGVWVMNADGTSPLRLTAATSANYSPAWSPDGARIAFISSRDGNEELYIMNAAGSGQTRITQTPDPEEDPAWSPDGQHLVVGRIAYCNYYCYSDLIIMNTDGTGERVLLQGSWNADPAWSPDDQWIAFTFQLCDYYYGCTAPAVSVIRADGTGLVQVLANALDPSWHP